MGEEKVYLCGIRVTINLKIVLPIQQHVISPRYTYKLYYANIFLHIESYRHTYMACSLGPRLYFVYLVGS